MEKVNLFNGNNLEVLKTLEPNSIDSIITDPPYGLSFMNKKWDYDVPSIEFWKEVYRVLKPGGHILSFGGTRTYHRMVVNMEDAGFEIRDQIMWIYGSGFPKSLNIGKGINNLENNEWRGWGTGLKPSNEPICLARKPISEKTIVKNVLKWRTGGINIDGCRVGIDGIDDRRAGKRTCNIFDEVKVSGGIDSPEYIPSSEGRFPANLIFECICDEVIKGEKGEVKKSGGSRENCELSHEWGYSDIVRTNFTDKGDIHTNPNCPCRLLDEQSGISITGASKPKRKYDGGNLGGGNAIKDYPSSKGGASRFFYVAKTSKKERNLTIDNNNHPTVKPIKLMSYLCKLITPPNGVILDPYMGSGSTGIAALINDFNFIGIEMDTNYYDIAQGRINNYEEYKKL